MGRSLRLGLIRFQPAPPIGQLWTEISNHARRGFSPAPRRNTMQSKTVHKIGLTDGCMHLNPLTCLKNLRADRCVGRSEINSYISRISLSSSINNMFI